MTKPRPMNVPELLTPAEVAHIFRVDPKTVTRWAKAGKLRYIKTVGGHRRYFRDDFLSLLQPDSPVRDADKEKW